MQNKSKIWDEVGALVEARGLAFFGVAGLGPEGDFARFSAWLDEGRHAGMTYLKENQGLRADPRGLLQGAQTCVVVGLNYFQGDVHSSRGDAVPRIAQYARLKDYHKVLWRRGEEILAALHERFDPQAVGRVVVDSAPILERALAARGGEGFIGKNTCFIDPDRGSYYLLAEILTSLALPVGGVEPVDPTQRGERGGCGSCKRCQVHCPTGALDQDYRLDANRCLAYWTIENRGEIPEAYWPWLRHYVYGCDICQLVCPYNRKAEPLRDTDLVRLGATPDLFEVATMDQATYERIFGGTPATRAKREGLMRNALIAMTVTNDSRLLNALAHVAANETAPVLKRTVEQVRGYRV